MSMLAEPRRKQKWSVDPRNSTWSNDDNKFGQKMLERMGWSKGKGLGRSEQGSTDHIKVKVKNNNYGLGANASHEDNWIAHQDEFNELLAQLNDHHGQNTSNEVPPDEMKSFSLEEKSKTSKKRVHYTKFTKGKDLSSRSETDLNCIFGKRTKSTKEQNQESSRSQSPVEAEESGARASSELDTESITKTVKSSLSMQEYFAQRMAQLKKARGSEGPAPAVEAEPTKTPSPAEVSPSHSSNSDAEEPKKKKKKKKKKNKKPDENQNDVEEKCSAPVENQEKAKKKKKRKTAEISDTNENSSAPSVVEMNCEEPRLSKKKKLKRTEKEPINGYEITEEHNVIQGEEEDNVLKEFEEELVAKKSKKKKRKRDNQE